MSTQTIIHFSVIGTEGALEDSRHPVFIKDIDTIAEDLKQLMLNEKKKHKNFGWTVLAKVDKRPLEKDHD